MRALVITGCCPVIGYITTGCGVCLDHGPMSARTTDIVMWPCGPGVITGSASSTMSQGMIQAKPGDTVTCPCGSGILGPCATNTMSM